VAKLLKFSHKQGSSNTGAAKFAYWLFVFSTGKIMQANQAINIEALLKRIPLFSGLSPTEVSRVANATREVRINKGETLFNKGDTYTGIHLLIKGQIKLTLTSAQGNEKIIEIVNEGQSFGEAI
jgi:hypothetical protein